jgi:hypothetical protein
MKKLKEKLPRPESRGGRPASLLLPLCLFLAAVASSCGLEDYPYLYPASASTSANTTLTFSHNTANDNAYFLGYEVYYRIYDGTASGASAVASTDGAYIESSWDSVTPDVVLARLKAKGYVRLVRLDRSVSPLVPISSPGSSATVQLSLDSSGLGYLFVGGSLNGSFTVRRNAYDSSGNAYRNFGDFTKGDDCNYEATGGTSNSSVGYAFVRAYAFAYGLNSSSLNTVVSRPSLLTNGAIPLTKGSSE